MGKINRYIGFNQIEEIKNNIFVHKRNAENDNSYIIIDNGLPNNIDSGLLEDLNPVIDSSYKIEGNILKSILLKYGLASDKYEHIIKIVELYIKNEKNINRQIVINFTAKIISWLRSYMRSSRVSYTIVYLGDIKKHGVYFLILLYLLGNNVYYYTLEDNDEFLRIKDIDSYSVLIKGSKFISEKDKKISDVLNEVINNNQSINNNEVINKTDITEHTTDEHENETGNKRMLNLERKAKDDDVLNTCESLTQFIDEINNEKIDVFYNGFIGCDASEENYNNILCELKKILNNKYKTIEILNIIPPLSNEEISVVMNNTNESANKKESYILLFKKYFNESRVFEEIISEFSEKNKSQSVIENFTLKLLTWSIRIKDFIMSDNEKKACLYFGNIKTHEIYFLKLLNRMHINVVYIFTAKEFNKDLIGIGQMKICMGSRFYDIKEYPKKSLTEVETTAYRAEQQVDSMLYNNETGMYRPYQLNEKEINSIILRTTLDEAFILWGEEAKYRSGFINADNHVENPVLFFKIDGVYKDIDEYYKLFVKLKNHNNTEAIYQTDIYENKYNNQEYYGANYLFDSSERVVLNKLKESRYYKYQYLDKNVQNHIIDKINELIKGKYLLFSEDKDFKIRVLLTILNLEEQFVRMLQKYDIGGEVPKIILYNNSRNQYSKDDSIIIMFMILMGADVVLLNPTGYVNIENMIDEKIISKFKLESVEYNLEIPDRIKNKKEKKSIFKRIFNI
ncbi:YceG family protein [uncultured Clostridium sp.]|uniref:YceG family protein n=1 Tax=uncultured Clostridium sp. TaxID=59620 RepID=UPI0025FEABC2|nr:YceG family protein [uncultured Clostridium sp.]